MSLDRMIEKAQKLLERGRVEHLNHERFNVIGDHGTYTVVQDYKGKISCSCPGFRKKRRCSHAVAVMILAARKKR